MAFSMEKIEKFVLRAREASFALLNLKCDVFGFSEVLDEKTGVLSGAQKLIFERLACGIFKKSLDASQKDAMGAEVSKVFTVFFEAGISIPEGCRLKIYDGEKIYDLYMTGGASSYKTHTEVKALLYKNFA